MIEARIITRCLRSFCNPLATSLHTNAVHPLIGGKHVIKESASVPKFPHLVNARKVHAASSGSPDSLIFRQLFHGETYTYTYILGCPVTRSAVIIDPVNDMVDRDVKFAEEMKLDLLYGLNTHVHADHVTGTGKLKQRLPDMKSVISRKSGAMADMQVDHGDEINFGKKVIKCLSTPGHTNGCMTYVLHQHAMAFTGDALLIRACGRTDFQEGSSEELYDSVHKKIFDLPENYFLYPGHDYRGFSVTTVAEEKLFNPRLTLSKEKFVEFMKNLDLAYPKLIDVSVPANLKCGEISKQAVLGSDDILNK